MSDELWKVANATGGTITASRNDQGQEVLGGTILPGHQKEMYLEVMCKVFEYRGDNSPVNLTVIEDSEMADETKKIVKDYFSLKAHPLTREECVGLYSQLGRKYSRGRSAIYKILKEAGAITGRRKSELK